MPFDYQSFTFFHENHENIQSWKNPLEVSMQRFRDKLLWNCLTPPELGQTFIKLIKGVATERPIHYTKIIEKKLFFLTLNVSNECYSKVFEAQRGSKTISNFLNAMRNFFRRDKIDRFGQEFEYAWRIERGTQETQRLHFHVLVQGDLDIDDLRGYCLSRWQYTDWVQFKRENILAEFEEAKDGISPALYACKYTAKHSGKGKVTLQLKNELKCRLYGTSHGFSPKPACVFPHVSVHAKSDGHLLQPTERLKPSEKEYEWKFIVPKHYRLEQDKYVQFEVIAPILIKSFKGMINRGEARREMEKYPEIIPISDERRLEFWQNFSDRIADIRDKFSYKLPMIPRNSIGKQWKAFRHKCVKQMTLGTSLCVHSA